MSPGTSVLALARFIRRVRNRLFGYQRFNLNLFTDRARKAVGWAQILAGKRGSASIDPSDFRAALPLVDGPAWDQDTPAPHLPFSADSKRLLEMAWSIKTINGDKYLEAAHIASCVNQLTSH